MIYGILSFSVLAIAVFFVWLTALHSKIGKLQAVFDHHLEVEQAAATAQMKEAGNDILVKYDRERYWLSKGDSGLEYISYTQAIRLILNHLGLVLEYVEGSKGYTQLAPKPEPEEKKQDD